VSDLIERALSKLGYHSEESKAIRKEIERLTAELKLYRTGEAYSLAAARIEELEAALRDILFIAGTSDGTGIYGDIARQALGDSEVLK